MLAIGLTVLGVALSWSVQAVLAESNKPAQVGEHLVTIYDSGQEHSLVTKAPTVGDALRQSGVELSSKDDVEPSTNTPLVGKHYNVNIYRARLVLIVDGAKRTSVITAAQSPRSIMKAAGQKFYDEDNADLKPISKVVASGAGLELDVDRATPFKFNLYGKTFTDRTQAKTVGQMLEKKGVKLGPKDGVTPAKSTPIKQGMTVHVWRNGTHTVTVEEKIKMPTKKVYDFDRPMGYKHVKTKGQTGTKEVTYEITMKRGKQVRKHKIAQVVTKKPIKQIVVIGAKPSGDALSVSKGVVYHRDSNGVLHRETYYDLPMGRVMQNCGAGGNYTVRADGVKVDPDGYIIVAADLNNYSRCSVVETSLGAGRVYDTGGFTSAHPYGFDLATDWTNHNGR